MLTEDDQVSSSVPRSGGFPIYLVHVRAVATSRTPLSKQMYETGRRRHRLHYKQMILLCTMVGDGMTEEKKVETDCMVLRYQVVCTRSMRIIVLCATETKNGVPSLKMRAAFISSG